MKIGKMPVHKNFLNSMSWFTTNLFAAFLLPPLSLFLALGLGIVMLHLGHKLAKATLLIVFCLLWLASTPYFSEGALEWLETQTAPVDPNRQSADAIVILGGGIYFHAPEYAGQDTIGELTLVRLRYGAKLQRESGKPILVTGGKPLGNAISEAQQMRAALEQDFHATVNWTEDLSRNTMENAQYSYRILHQAGIRRIYLVTHAWHMPRSADIFRHIGFEVIEAPTAYTTHYQIDLLSFLPCAEGLRDSKIFIHELVGLLWYRLKSIFL